MTIGWHTDAVNQWTRRHTVPGNNHALLPYIEQVQICRSHKEDGEMHVQRLSGNPIIRPYAEVFLDA